MQYITTISEKGRKLLEQQGYKLVSTKITSNNQTAWTYADSSDRFCFDNKQMDKSEFYISNKFRLDFSN